MTKFKDTKVGDTVFVEKEVSYGWHKSESFYVPREITRVTKTQVCIGNDRYRRDSGNKIGGGYGEKIYKEGHIISVYTGQIMYDQTAEMEAFIKKLNLETAISKYLSSIKIDRNSSLSVKKLEKIKLYLCQIDEILTNTSQ